MTLMHKVNPDDIDIFKLKEGSPILEPVPQDVYLQLLKESENAHSITKARGRQTFDMSLAASENGNNDIARIEDSSSKEDDGTENLECKSAADGILHAGPDAFEFLTGL